MQTRILKKPTIRRLKAGITVFAAISLFSSSRTASAQTPTITGTNPSSIPMGESNRITVLGNNFVNSTVILFNGMPVPTTYISSTSINAYFSAEANLAGTLVLAAQNLDGSTSADFAVSLGTPSSTWATVSTTPARTIPAGFMGLSHEWDAGWVMGGSTTQRGINYAYRKLVGYFMDSPSSSFLIRIGGSSTDQTTSPNSVAEFADLRTALPGIKFTTGVPLGADVNSTPGTAEAAAAAYVSGLGSGLDSIEIGNESDSYQYLGSSSYTFDIFNSKYSQWTSAILSNTPATPGFTGPSWASMRTLLNDNYWSNFVNEPPSYLQLFINAQKADTKTITQHWYSGMNPPNYQPDFLLGYPPANSPAALQYANPNTTGFYYWAPAVFGQAASLAHKNNVAYRVNESNTIDQSGVDGVSNSFAAALWAVDYMFELVNAGVDGVNFHGIRYITAGSTCTNLSHTACNPKPYYSPFSFTIQRTNGNSYPLIYTLDSVNPLYYGLYFFHLAAPGVSQLLPVTMQSPYNIKVWATKDSAGTVRVAVINKDKAYSGNVRIQLSGYGNGTGLVMSCANGFGGTLQYVNDTQIANTGITIAGQTWDGSTDGTIQGTQTTISIPAYPNGSGANYYYVPVQPGQAVLLTLTP